MGMCLDVFIHPKVNGKLYHDLTSREKNDFLNDFYEEDENKELEVLLRGDGNWNLLDTVRELTFTVHDDEDDCEVITYIDENNIDIVITKIKEKIHIEIENVDKYDKCSFGDDSNLYTYCELLEVIEKFKNNNDLNKEYLCIFARW